MNRTDRLVAIVMYLQGRRVVRAGELAKHFEVTIRTVYRDIAALSEAGVPVAGEAGVGYTLVKGYHLPPVMLTAEEAAALFLGGEIVKGFTDASFREPMATALDKLRAVLPRERQDQVARLSHNTVVMGGSRCTRAEQDPAAQPWLMAVQQSVAQQRVLRLRYRGKARPEETAREVEPLGVAFYGGAWYLVGWCRLRSALRHFRVDRIQGLAHSGETFTTRENFSLVRHLEENIEKVETFPARVWFARAAQERAARESHATLVADGLREDGTDFALYTYSLDWLAGWILSFGGEAQALEPEELRERVGAKIARLQERHQPAQSADIGLSRAYATLVTV